LQCIAGAIAGSLPLPLPLPLHARDCCAIAAPLHVVGIVIAITIVIALLCNVNAIANCLWPLLHLEEPHGVRFAAGDPAANAVLQRVRGGDDVPER
jgi:hypothetical protein